MSERVKRLLVRVLLIVPSLWAMVTVVFFLVRLTGDPVRVVLGDYGTPEMEAALRARLGLDRPLPVQYGVYLWNLLQGDLGQSLVDGSPVLSQILVAVPHTLMLSVSAFFVAVLLSVPLGIVAAVRRNSWVDMAAVAFAIAGRVIPSFVLGIMLMLVFCVYLDLMPMMGVGDSAHTIVSHLVLPAVALGLHEAGLICRMVRSALLEVLGSDYVRTARAKGLSERVVLWKHALRNALIPISTVLGLRLARLIGGSVVIETLFVRIGMGRLMVDSIYARDFPMVQGTILVFGLWVLVVNLLVDLAYGVLDPRVQGI